MTLATTNSSAFTSRGAGICSIVSRWIVAIATLCPAKIAVAVNTSITCRGTKKTNWIKDRTTTLGADYMEAMIVVTNKTDISFDEAVIFLKTFLISTIGPPVYDEILLMSNKHFYNSTNHLAHINWSRSTISDRNFSPRVLYSFSFLFFQTLTIRKSLLIIFHHPCVTPTHLFTCHLLGGKKKRAPDSLLFSHPISPSIVESS